MTHSDFDHTPDLALGDALRDVLATGDDAAFARRVMAQLGTADAWWQVLGAWARPGLVAALLLVAAGGFFLGRMLGPTPASSTAAVTPVVAVSSLFGDDRAPDLDVVLTEGIGR